MPAVVVDAGAVVLPHAGWMVAHKAQFEPAVSLEKQPFARQAAQESGVVVVGPMVVSAQSP